LLVALRNFKISKNLRWTTSWEHGTPLDKGLNEKNKKKSLSRNETLFFNKRKKRNDIFLEPKPKTKKSETKRNEKLRFLTRLIINGIYMNLNGTIKRNSS
jgi:hypothetical protein